MENFSFKTALRALYLNVFAVYFILFKTVKKSWCATVYLPSVWVQKLIIRLSGFNKKFLCKREWSPEVRVWLLQQKTVSGCAKSRSVVINTTLINDIRTQKEFDEIILTKDIELILRALCIFTPKKDIVIKLCNDTDLLDDQVLRIAKEAPQTFYNLSIDDILVNILKRRSDKMLEALIEARPEQYAVEVMKYLEKHGNHHQDDVCELYEAAFNAAFKLKADISSSMRFMKSQQVYEDFYNLVVEKRYLYSDFTPYICVELGPELNSGLIYPNFDVMLKKCFWLNLALYSKDERCFYQIMNYWTAITRAVYPNVQKELFCHLVKKAKSNKMIARMLDVFGYNFDYKYEILNQAGKLIRDYKIPMLNHSTISEALLSLYPFDNSTFQDLVGEDMIKLFLEELVVYKKFPIDKVALLSEDLQSFVASSLEEQSQCDLIIKEKNLDILLSIRLAMPAYIETQSLVDCRFEPKAEKMLLSYSTEIKQIENYLNETKMHNSTFLHFLAMSNKEHLFKLFAKAHGLSNDQYFAMMNSQYSYLAPQLKQYVV